jgi:nicotinate-nucleotide adenylyltransferase
LSPFGLKIMGLRIGIFGGTFDPVHLGHLILAEQCREQAKLDQVWFVPALLPPHKQDWTLTPFAQRVEMLALAIAGQPAFRIEELEKERPGPSYTVDTLDTLHARHPDHSWHLLIGSDTQADLPLWRQPERIVQLAELLIMVRPDHVVLAPEQLKASLRLANEVQFKQRLIDAPLIEISSSDLRRRVSEGRSLRFMVSRAVECYIHDKQLYQGR